MSFMVVLYIITGIAFLVIPIIFLFIKFREKKNFAFFLQCFSTTILYILPHFVVIQVANGGVDDKAGNKEVTWHLTSDNSRNMNAREKNDKKYQFLSTWMHKKLRMSKWFCIFATKMEGAVWPLRKKCRISPRKVPHISPRSAGYLLVIAAVKKGVSPWCVRTFRARGNEQKTALRHPQNGTFPYSKRHFSLPKVALSLTQTDTFPYSKWHFPACKPMVFVL